MCTFQNDGLYDIMIATDAPNAVPEDVQEVDGEEEQAEAEEESKKSMYSGVLRMMNCCLLV